MKLTILLFSFLLCAPALATSASEWENGEDLRLSLGDQLQERRTTSVNWPDLVPTDGEKSEPAPVMVPKRLRIVIDAGHGGKDLGSRGHFDILEKQLCLKIGWMVKARLESAFRARGIPADVILSRDRDVYLSLRDRVRIANQTGADLFVSIHANSSEFEKARGFEVYFLSAEASDAQARRVARIENAEHSETPLKSNVMSILSDLQATQHVAESSRFAEVLFQAMARNLKPNGRGVRQAPFTVLAGTTMPALLVEVGYLTNPLEAQLLRTPVYLKRLANAISTGIFEFATRVKRVG